MPGYDKKLKAIDKRLQRAKAKGKQEDVDSICSERLAIHEKKKEERNANKRLKVETASACGQKISSVETEAEEQKISTEVEKSVTDTTKIQSLSSVEKSTTIRQVNGGAAETVTETKTVNCLFLLFVFVRM